jgi:hypothetical protein
MNSTYSRRSQTVSTVKKSHATIPAACWQRNARQVVAARRSARVEPVAAQRGADHRRRDAHTKAEQLALDALVAPDLEGPGAWDKDRLQARVPTHGDQPVLDGGDHAASGDAADLF